MSNTETPERRANPLNDLLEHLHNPIELRLALIAVVLVIGYFAVYQPLNGQIVAATRKLEDARKELNLAHNVEQLRERFGKVEKRLLQQTDSREWVQYVMAGIRQFPLTLSSLNCDPPRDLGPYKAVVLQIRVSGSFADLDRFLSWLESNKRLLRVDAVNIYLGYDKTGTDLVMNLTLLGVMG